MGKIMVAGAAGNLGMKCAEELIDTYEIPADQMIVTTSGDLSKLQKFADLGIECRTLNYNGPYEDLVEAFKGADTVVMVSVPFVGQKRRDAHIKGTDACVEAGVKKIVYTSIVGAACPDIDAYEINDHIVIEKYMMDAPINVVLVRNSQYTEAMVGAYEEALAGDGVIANNMGEGLMAFVSRDDCARFAAACAAGKGEDDAIYFCSGPEGMPCSKLVEYANQATGNDVKYQFVTDEENYAFLDSIGVPRTTEGEWGEAASNFPFCGEGIVTFGRAIRLGQMYVENDDFEKIVGHKPLSVYEVFRDLENHRVGERVSTDD